MVDSLIKQQGTLLILVGMGVPLYSSRDLTQTLEPIPAATVQRRTINGDLVDLSYPQFDKYQSEITCRDFKAPALDGIWPGRTITVYCAGGCELIYPVGGSAGRPARTDVPLYNDGNGFIHYLPILQMRVRTFQISSAEWKATVAWKLNLEEI